VLGKIATAGFGWLVPLSRPSLGDEEIAGVVECLKSGWLTSGPVVREFESAFAQFIGSDIHASATSSGTAGLILALQALGIGEGGEVITTANTFIATAQSIIAVGAVPVLADIDPVSLNVDPVSVEAAITPRTRAILPVHIAGLACDVRAIRAIADQYGLKVVEDAAHAFPASAGNRLIGDHTADATVFSFYASKTLTTGEGGMVVTPDTEVTRCIRVLRLHGIDKDTFDRRTDPARSWHYDVVEPGHKANMPDYAAAIGIEQLRKAPAFRRRRATIAAQYSEAFAGLPLILPADAPGDDLHAWHLYIVRLAPEAPLTRDMFITRMAECGIQCGVHFIPLHCLTYWRERFGSCDDDFPNALRAYQATATLPLFSAMTDGDVELVVTTVRRLLG
jgi:dTDP-4-amino-4,6-dideoxygalactose transaminase